MSIPKDSIKASLLRKEISKHFSEEHKRKIRRISEAQKLKLLSIQKFGKRDHWLGRHFSETHKRRIGESTKKRFDIKGRISSDVHLIRGSLKYNEWRQSIFIRDKFTCKKCGKNGGELNAHHNIKAFKQLLGEVKKNLPLFSLYEGSMIYTPLWDTDNGITLCKKCHDLTKRKGVAISVKTKM